MDREDVVEKSVDVSENDRYLENADAIARIWTAISDVSNDEQKHHTDVARRLRILEESGRKKYDDDPTKFIIEAMIWAMVLQFGIPLLLDLVASLRGGKKELPGE
jgi:hypothetical protein